MLTKLSVSDVLVVSREEAKARLAVLESDWDEEIDELIEAASAWVAHAIGRVLVPTTFLWQQNGWGCSPLFIPVTPVRKVTEVAYLAEDGSEVTVDPALWRWRRSDLGDGALLTFQDGFSRPHLARRDDNVRVTLNAGYDSPDASGSGDDPELQLPRQARQAVFLLVGHWFKNKEAVGSVGTSIDLGVSTLVAQLKVFR